MALLDLNITPHVWRHTGASVDILHQRRSLRKVKKRGRWVSDSAAARYSKPAVLLQQASKLSSSQTKEAARAAADFPKSLKIQLPAFVKYKQ